MSSATRPEVSPTIKELLSHFRVILRRLFDVVIEVCTDGLAITSRTMAMPDFLAVSVRGGDLYRL